MKKYQITEKQRAQFNKMKVALLEIKSGKGDIFEIAKCAVNRVKYIPGHTDSK